MDFSMEVPKIKDVEKEVAGSLAPSPEEKSDMEKQVAANSEALFTVDLSSLEDRKRIVSAIESFGSDTVVKSSSKNKLLQTRMSDLSRAGGESSAVVSGLADLQLQMRDLDPSKIDFAKRGILGKILNPVRAYFAKFEKADDAIAEIVESLVKGKSVLKNDNTTLEIEQQALRDLTKQISEQVAMGMEMDRSIEAAIAKARAEGIDPDRIKFVEEEILFPLRQRVMDLQQMQAVNMQGIIAMEVIIRNNKELIRAVERAENVTVSALKIAVTVASALYNQQVVLEKVNAINAATNELISKTSQMLKTQGSDIQNRAMEANISVETLQQAFRDTFDALDAISSYKEKALPQMRTTIDQFRVMADEGAKRIAKMDESKND